MSATIFLALLPFSSYAVVLPLVRADWGLTNTEAAFLFSAYLIGLALASLVFVPLTDRHPPELVLISGVGLLTVSSLLFPFLARDLASAAVLRALAGAGHAAAYFPGIRLVARRFASGNRGSAVAAFVGAGYLGTTLSYAVTGAFLSRTGRWQEAYAATAALALVAIPLGYVLCRKQALSEGRRVATITLEPLLHRPLALAIVAYALHSAELYLARLWLPLLLTATLVQGGADYDGAVATAASLSGAMFTGGVAGVFFGGALSDRIGRTAAAAWLFALSGACSVAIAWQLDGSLPFIINVGFVYGFALAADSSIYATAVTELASPGTLGSAQALQSFAGFLAGAIAPVAGGALLDAFAGGTAWTVTFGLNALVALAGVSVLVALRRDPRAAAMARGKR